MLTVTLVGPPAPDVPVLPMLPTTFSDFVPSASWVTVVEPESISVDL